MIERETARVYFLGQFWLRSNEGGGGWCLMLLSAVSMYLRLLCNAAAANDDCRLPILSARGQRDFSALDASINIVRNTVSVGALLHGCARVRHQSDGQLKTGAASLIDQGTHDEHCLQQVSSSSIEGQIRSRQPRTGKLADAALRRSARFRLMQALMFRDMVGGHVGDDVTAWSAHYGNNLATKCQRWPAALSSGR